MMRQKHGRPRAGMFVPIESDGSLCVERAIRISAGCLSRCGHPNCPMCLPSNRSPRKNRPNCLHSSMTRSSRSMPTMTKRKGTQRRPDVPSGFRRSAFAHFYSLSSVCPAGLSHFQENYDRTLPEYRDVRKLTLVLLSALLCAPADPGSLQQCRHSTRWRPRQSRWLSGRSVAWRRSADASRCRMRSKPLPWLQQRPRPAGLAERGLPLHKRS